MTEQDLQTLRNRGNESEAAAEEIDRLQARCAALEADAMRYRWLRDKADFLRLKEGSPQVCMTDEWGGIVSTLPSAYPRGRLLDAAIDAAAIISTTPAAPAEGAKNV